MSLTGSAPIPRTLVVGSVALVSLIAFDYLAVATAMPTVARALDGESWYALSFAGALAAGVVGKVAAGGWSDARGPGAPLWTGVAGFAVGLVVAALAPTMLVLVLGRIVQGLAGGLLFVALYVVVGRVVPPDQRPRLIAAFAAAWVVPSVVGPAVTGAIVEYANWRWVFLALAALAVPAALLVRPAVRAADAVPPESPPARAESVRRLLWAAGAAGSVVLLHYGGSLRGLAAPALLGLALAGVAAAAARLLPPGTLRAGRGLPAVVALRALAGAAFVSTEVFIPLMLARERGFSPAAAGLALTVGALSWSVGAWYQGRPGQRFTRTRLLQFGMAFVGTGVVAVSLVLVPAMPAVLALAGWSVSGLGMGLVYPSLTVLTLELSPVPEHGRNISALQLWDSLFTAATLSVTGALFAGLLPYASPAAYLAGFGIAAGLTLLGVAVATRTRAQGDLPRVSRR